jgi:signal recognition particle subunit SRP14
LIRATDGKRKISTAVSAGDYVKFQASYGLILRAHMDALKKREKTKAKK